MNVSWLNNARDFLTSRRLMVMLPLGFASGLPLALTGGTLQAWLAVERVDIATIGLFSMVGLPYTLKFLWSPLMDRFSPKWLGRRRGWMAIIQMVLAAGICLMAFLSPGKMPGAVAAAALLVAASSASQDIVIDAYRTDILKSRERGLGAGLSVTGYRIAMLVSGALALIMADHIGWHTTYLMMAGIMGFTIVFTLMAPKTSRAPRPTNMGQAIVGPLRDFFSRPGALLFLLLVVLYKLGDATAGTLTTAFLISGVGFSPTDVGTINKGMGLIATLLGAVTGGSLMARIGLFQSLMYFGILQAVSNLSFMVLAWIGKSYPAMVTAVAFENISGGMGTAAFVAFLMALCHKKYSATQYALLSAIAALGRVFAGPPSGLLVASIGWTRFFFVSTLVALPGLFLLAWMKGRIESMERS